MSADADQLASSDDQYHVVCEECDLDEEYSDHDIAVGRGLEHFDVTGHIAHVEGGPDA